MSPPRPSDDLAMLEERSRAFLRQARGLRGLTPHQVDRIAHRLKQRRPARRGGVLVRAFAVAALVLMAGVAAAWASGALARWPGLKAYLGRGGATPAATAPATKAAPAAPPAAGGAVSMEPPQLAPTPATATAEEHQPSEQPPGSVPRRLHPAEQRPGPRRHRASVAADRLPNTPRERSDPDASIVLEGRSLAAALELWRARKDVHAALAALDRHDLSFPAGEMRVEAQALRAEILLAARREADALAVLDRLPLAQIPRGRELTTLRGELRVRLGRCDEGRRDLESLSRGADALATRARAALAGCR